MTVLICLVAFHLSNIPVIASNTSASKTSLPRKEENKPNCWTDEIRYKIVKKYTQKYGLKPCVISDAMPNGIINRTGVSFTIDRPISKEKARQILVECVQEYILAINNKKELRPYLKNYPVTSKNIEVVLFIHDTNGEKLFYPNLGIAGCHSGCVEYTTHDPDKSAYKTVEEETFEEAVIKVKEELPKEDLL